MGMYDMIEYVCKHCEKITTSQTKQFECVLHTFHIGDKIDFEDCILEMKERCEHCSKHNAIEIKDRKIIAVRCQEDATVTECVFGSLEERK